MSVKKELIEQLRSTLKYDKDMAEYYHRKFKELEKKVLFGQNAIAELEAE
jgi:hypothetical protein